MVKPENRLKHAVKILNEINAQAEERKGINNSIQAEEKKMEEKLSGDEKNVTIKQIKSHFSRVRRLESERKEVNALIGKLKNALADCIQGKGDYDKRQMTIDDYLAEREKIAGTEGELEEQED